MTGNVVHDAALMNNQKQFTKRRKKNGPEVSEDMSIQARFQRFHDSNPEVYNALVGLARKLKRAGLSKYGIVGLYEVLRYDRSVKPAGGEPFKLTNDFRSRYARLIMEREKDLDGFFTTRELQSL